MNATKTTPIILGGITAPVGSGLVKSETNPGGNVTGVAGAAPIGDQLNLMKQVIPDLKTLGIIYTSSDAPSASQMKEMKTLAEKNGITVKVSSISSVNDLQQVGSALARKVQTIYVPTDNTVASGMKLLSAIAAKQAQKNGQILK